MNTDVSFIDCVTFYCTFSRMVTMVDIQLNTHGFESYKQLKYNFSIFNFLFDIKITLFCHHNQIELQKKDLFVCNIYICAWFFRGHGPCLIHGWGKKTRDYQSWYRLDMVAFVFQKCDTTCPARFHCRTFFPTCVKTNSPPPILCRVGTILILPHVETKL